MSCLQECLRVAQTQVSVVTHPSPEVEEADGEDQEDRDSLQHMEAQWSTAAGDSSSLVQRKEAHLQLVTTYAGQTEAVAATLEGLEEELEARGL